MKTLKQILNFLSGKKSVIVGVIMTTIAYLGTKGILGTDDVTFIGAITTILFGTTSYLTSKYVYNK